jgi:dihydrofolate reductase
MRKLVVAEFISLDGVVEAPETWHMPYVDEELMGAVQASGAAMDTMLLGRVTYETFAGAFADAPADDPVAASLNRPEKVVVSGTLRDPSWGPATVLAGDVVAGIRALKERPGGDILTTGSISLVRTMLAAGLVDELQLMIHPLAVGSGRRLFEEPGPRVGLSLARADVFASGVVNAIYTPAEGTR